MGSIKKGSGSNIGSIKKDRISSRIQEINRYLIPLRIKISFNTLIFFMLAGLLAAAFFVFAASVISLIIPVPFAIRHAYYIAPSCIIGSVIISLFFMPDYGKTASVADSLGLKERISTALEFSSIADDIYELQREDALDSIKNIDIKKQYKIKIDKIYLIFAASFFMAAVLFFHIETPAREKAGYTEVIVKEIDKQAKKLEEIKNDLIKISEKDNGQEDERVKRLEEDIEELIKSLKKAKSTEQAVKELAKAENRIEQIKNENQPMKKLLDKNFSAELSSSQYGAMKDNDLAKLAQELEQMLKEMTAEQLDNLIDDIKETKEKLTEQKNDEALKALEEAVKGLEAENMQKAAEMLASALQQSGQSGEGQGQQSSAFASAQEAASDAISSARKSIASKASEGKKSAGSQSGSAQADSGQSGSSGQQGSGSQSSQSSSQGSQSGQGQQGESGGQDGQGEGSDQQGSGSSDQQGSGSQSGQGQQGESGGQDGQGEGSDQQGSSSGQQTGTGQNSSGEGGGGAGDGSTGADTGFNDGIASGGYKAAESGQGTASAYESIYIPQRLGGSGEESYITGQKGSGGQSTWKDAWGAPVDEGVAVGYNEVIGQYRDYAFNSIENAQIPPGMKDIVREYFTSFE